MTPTICTILAETLTNSAAYKIGQILGFLIIAMIPVLFILSLIRFILTKRKRWLVGLIITSLCGCAFAVMVGYIAYETFQEASSATAKGGAALQSVETSDGLLTLDVPKAWTELEVLSDAGSLRYGHLRKEQYLIVISQEKIDFDENFTLIDYGQACLENTKDVASKYEEGEWSSSEVAGRPMMEIELDTVVDKIKILYLHGFYETENHYHQVMQWTLPSKWEKSKPVFKAVLESVRLSSSEDNALKSE